MSEPQSTDMTRTKYQTGTVQRMIRKDIRGADYNPRVIDDTARERLMENVRRRGLMGPALIVNGRTGTLVSGHQRLGVLDTLEGRDDYMIDVTVVSLTDEEER